MKLTSQQSAVRKAISLAPLIDVVFILLLFFMLTTQFMTRSTMTLDLNRTSSNVINNQTGSVFVLRLMTGNRVSVDGNEVALDDPSINKLLVDAFSNDRRAVLRFDNDANVQALTHLMDSLHRLSIDSAQLSMGW